MASNQVNASRLNAWGAQNVLASVTPSVAVGVLFAILFIIWRGTALGLFTVYRMEWLVVSLPVLGVIGAGMMLMLRGYLRSFGNAYVPAVIAVGAVVGAYWFYSAAGPSLVEEGLSAQDPFLFGGVVAAVTLLLTLVVDGSDLALRAWLVLQAVVVTVLLAATLLALLLAVPGVEAFHPWGVGVGAAVFGFLAVRVGRNALLGVEALFISEAVLTWVTGAVLLLAGTAGYSVVLNVGVDFVQALGFGAAAAAAWFVLAYLRQRPTGRVVRQVSRKSN